MKPNKQNPQNPQMDKPGKQRNPHESERDPQKIDRGHNLPK